MGGKCLLLESKEIISFVYGKGICSLHRLLKAAKVRGLSIPEKGRAQGFANSMALLTHSHQCPYL